MATNPEHIITDNPHVIQIERDLALEAAACLAAIIDARREKTLENQRRNLEIKALEKRGLALVEEIRSGDTQLKIKFGSTVSTTRALASTAPKDGEDEKDLGVGKDAAEESIEQDETDEAEEETPEATH